MATRIVAIDGYGGSGKSTLARRLAAALDGAPMVPTDDFASWDDQFEWWPRLLEQVIAPLARGEIARYQRFDWTTRQLAEWIALPRKPAAVIIEGVAAMRREFDPYLAYRIWVDTPPAVRLRRGLERDGQVMRAQWDRWMAAEAAYVEMDRPMDRADAVVRGAG
jgi:uridine kinase